MDLTNKTELLNYLKQHNLWAKKGLGQNFLVDKSALDKIVEAAEIEENDLIIEVGPGVGTLTSELIKQAGEVVAIEMDEKLVELLGQEFKIYNLKFKINDKSDNLKKDVISSDIAEGEESRNLLRDPSTEFTLSLSNGVGMTKEAIGMTILSSGMTAQNKLEIINSDILKVNLDEIIGDRKYKVVANIPYYITSKIIELFLTAENKPESIVLLVQKEVAERICAKAGGMSVLSVSVQLYGQPEIVGIVKKESFFPSPKVDSAILKISNINNSFCHPELVSGSHHNEKMLKQVQHDKFMDEKAFFRCVHIGFASRRKTLANNLSSGYRINKKKASDIINAIGLSESVRAQELSIEDWKKLAQEMKHEL